jgi:hypothetical protein
MNWQVSSTSIIDLHIILALFCRRDNCIPVLTKICQKTQGRNPNRNCCIESFIFICLFLLTKQRKLLKALPLEFVSQGQNQSMGKPRIIL